MKKTAYVFGIIGYFSIFVLSTFEMILMSVNSYGLSTVVCLYLFFALNILGAAILASTYFENRYSLTFLHKRSFNLNNRGVAILYLVLPIISGILLINSNCYNLNTNNPIILILGFLQSPELYLPIIPLIISGILFVLNSSANFQIKLARVSHF